jgi:ATP-dependent RNA helicase DDX56/DBP9
LIGTPARVSQLSLNFFESVSFLVVDEADQQLGLDHGPDIEAVIARLPPTRQSFLMSATLGDEVERLQTLVLNNPLRLDVADGARASLLSHYYLAVPPEHRFEVLYGLIQTGAIGRRVLVFVNTTTAGYKLRLFLERFGIKSSVLNAQLPVASRIHILQEFNRGGIDMLVAIDETDDALTREFSAARGVDFQNLAAVLNFDLPPTVEQYVHRVGRTARAMREGAAVSFVARFEEFAPIADFLKTEEAVDVAPLEYNIRDAEIFRYRVNGVLETITKKQIKECKKADIKREILNSERLKAHFEENPADLKILKHDAFLFPAKVDRALKVLPDYLGSQVKRQQHPLTQKARQAKAESGRAKSELAKLDAINRALKRHRKKKK